MKKLFICLMILTLSLGIFSACSGGGGDNNTSEVPENAVYVQGTELTVVKDDLDFPDEMTSAVISAAQKATGKSPKFRKSSVEPGEHEIVIGPTEREISRVAYSLLEESSFDYAHYVVYTDGASIAIAYSQNDDALAAVAAAEYLIAECLSGESFVHKPGVVYLGEINVTEYYQAKDDAMLAERWKKLEEYVGGQLGKDVADAFRDLYEIYDDEVVAWFANLYSPRICVCEGECQGTAECYGGGYYYSNSARDTAGFLPDAESTSQALNFIQSSGMGWHNSSYKNTIPEWMAAEISDFIYYLQDPDDGYFYHPQWGKSITTTRKGRDFTWCNGILNTLGRKPRYSSITSSSAELTAPLGAIGAVAVSKVIAADGELNIPSHLVDEASFRAYLAGYDDQMATRSYSIGSELSSQTGQINARDKTLAAQGAEYSLMDILIEWLNSHQNPSTGTWDADRDYHSVNGLLKISGVYNAAKVMMPYAEEAAQSAVDAIVSDEPVGAVVDIYNTWFSFGNIVENLRNYGGETGPQRADAIVHSLREQAPASIAASKAKIILFKKDSGSFSYNLKYSSATSCGAPAAVPESVEGDVNATVISITGLTMNIYEALELYSYRVPIYTYSDWRVYENILNGLEPIVKDMEINIGEPIDFEDETVGSEPSDVSYTGGANSTGSLTVVDDPRTDGAGKVINLKSFSGAGDTVTVNNTVSALHAKVFVFESDYCFLTAEGGYVAQITIGNSAYMYIFQVKGDTVELWDASSANGSVALYNQFPVSAKLGEWFNVRAEYYYGDHNSVRIKMYWNGELVGITDNYYDHSGKKLTATGSPSSSYSTTRVYIMNSAKVELLMDNMHAYKKAEVYTPEEVGIPGAPNVDVQEKPDDTTGESTPVSGDFEDAATDSLPPFVTSSLVSSGASVGISEMTRNGESTKVLTYTTTAGGNDALYLAPTTKLSGYKSVVFEADLMIDTTQKAVLYQMMFETTSSAKSYMLNISANSNGICITDSSSTSGTSANRRENTVADPVAAPGEWFNLRVEYYVGGRTTLRAHVYVNGTLVYVSDNFYGYYDGNDPDPVNKIDRVRFYTMNASAATLHVDNFSLIQSSETNPSPTLPLGKQ